jgi:hypothetical protein
MCFDKFLLAVESRDLSQADKSIIRVSSFPKAVFENMFLNDTIYIQKNYLALGNFCFGHFYHSKVCKIEK